MLSGRSPLTILLPLLLLLPLSSSSQCIRIDLDSIYVYCRYGYMESAIRKENTEENAAFRLNELAVIKKNFSDTVFLDENTFSQFVNETEWLFKKGQVKVYDNEKKRMVAHLKRRRGGKRGHVTYFIYYDSDTKNELFFVGIRTWQKF